MLGYCITDEVFGVSYTYEGNLNPLYTFSAMFLPAIGWSAGTFLGITVGNVLPKSVMSALGVALYAMFIAIIVPPAKKNKVIAIGVIFSMATSWVFTKVSVLERVSSGFKIIIITVAVSAVLALMFPVENEVENEA